MKKMIISSISSIAIGLLLLTGCSTKTTSSENNQDQEEVKEVPLVETVSAENTTVINENTNNISDSNEMNMASLENKMKSIYFAFDEFSIDSKMQSDISADAKIATEDANQFLIKLEGNCDEWGSDEYNFALGLKRANAVKKSLIAEGVASKRITMVSYGESNPTCTDKTQECWTKNRRVDFKLLP